MPAPHGPALPAALGRAETALRCAVAAASVRRTGVRPLGSRAAHRTLGGVFLDLLCCHCLLAAAESATATTAFLVPRLLRQSAEELGLYFGPHVPATGPGDPVSLGREQLQFLHAELSRLASEDGPGLLDADRIGAAFTRLRSTDGGEPYASWLRSAAAVYLDELAVLISELHESDPEEVDRAAAGLAERRALLMAAAICAEAWPTARAEAPSTFVPDPAWLTGILLRTAARLGTAPPQPAAPDALQAATAELLARCTQGRGFDLHGTPPPVPAVAPTRGNLSAPFDAEPALTLSTAARGLGTAPPQPAAPDAATAEVPARCTQGRGTRS
jgi:hypothetical protein